MIVPLITKYTRAMLLQFFKGLFMCGAGYCRPVCLSLYRQLFGAVFCASNACQCTFAESVWDLSCSCHMSCMRGRCWTPQSVATGSHARYLQTPLWLPSSSSFTLVFHDAGTAEKRAMGVGLSGPSITHPPLKTRSLLCSMTQAQQRSEHR